MLITKIIRCNLALLVVVGIYGLASDEPYWRDVGHGPSLYDYVFWLALVMNGPSGLAADYLSWLVARHAEIRFVLQYAFWCALLWPQWQLYLALARWCWQTRARRMVSAA